MIKVITIVTGMLEENCYIIHNDIDALIVDPGDNSDIIINPESSGQEQGQNEKNQNKMTNHPTKNQILNQKEKPFFLVYLTPFILANMALAAGGGIDKVNDFMQNLSTALYGIGAVVLTIAFMWAGFKVMFQGQTLREVAPVFIGGVIVGSASAIAAYIIS